jgi:hypothetical protein
MLVESALVITNPREDLAIMALYDEANKLLEYANNRVIATLDDTKLATNDLSLISRLKKAMESKRKDYLLPFQEHVKEVNDIYKALMAPVETADMVTRNKVMAFNREQERIKAEQEKINALRMEAAQKEAALNNGEIKESIVLVDVIQPVTKVIADLASSGMRDNWTYEVMDFAALPNEYKMPNTSMLNATAKSVKDSRVIPGLRIYNEPTMVVRNR